MGLTKADILQTVIVGLTLVASAIAVPVMASGQHQSAPNSSVSHQGQFVK
jgi:hypothetical protein